MMINIKCIIGSALAAIIVSLVLANTPSAHAIVTLNTSVPVSFTSFVPCANNGKGETVAFSGTEHILIIDNNNNNNGKFQFQFQGVTGVGLTTGDRYQATGLDEEPFTGSGFTEVNNFYLIGQGAGNNLLAHQLSHITVNADGTITANVDNFSIECR